jgi:uroporphyrinogen decarboxylase
MADKITSRERVRMALEHKEADRVPIDLGAMRATGISAIAYNRLRKKIGIKKGLARMYDIVQALAYPEEGIRKRFHIDCIDSGQAFLKNNNDWKKYILEDGSECLIPKYIKFDINKNGTLLFKNDKGTVVAKKPKSSYYVDQTYWPLADYNSIPIDIDATILGDFPLASIPSPPWHLNIYDNNQFQTFIKEIKKIHEDTEYSIMLATGCKLFEASYYLRRLDNYMVDYMTDKKGTERLLDKLMEIHFNQLERIISGVGDYVDLISIGDDLGTQGGPFVPPAIFKDIFYPRYKKMLDYVHSKSDIKVFLHSDGNIFELIPYLIDAGFDALNPVQTTGKDMNPEKLKNEFGKDITFWGGGVDTQNILPSKTPAEVKEDVKRRIEIFAKGGGFVFNQVHNILADVPSENIIAMFEAAYDFGRY